MKPKRFLDTGETIYQFGARFLVRCPRCERCAEVVRAGQSDEAEPMLFTPHRLVCAACGYTREWTGAPYDAKANITGMKLVGVLSPASLSRGGRRRPVIYIGGPFDWYFRLPLWLQTPCCGEILWAYNAEHLAYLRGFVTAQLRERAPGASTRSTASRLPHWMITAKNRDEVTRGLERLERLLVAE